MPPTDPKDVITPYAFRVEPALLGTPIARPFRRAVAMLADLLVLSMLLLLREMSGALLGIVIAWALFRISGRTGERKVQGPVTRPVLRITAFLVLFVSLALAFQSCFGIAQRGTITAPTDRASGEADTGLRLGEAAGLLTAVGRVAAAGDSATAQAAADRVALYLARTGVPRAEREEALRELTRAAEAPWRASVARLAVERSARAQGERGEEAAIDPPEDVAADRADIAARDTVPPADSLAPEARALAEALAAAARDSPPSGRTRRDPGIRAFLRSVADDLGIGIGWAGIYFTIFTVLMGGRTPGKRLLGIRVVRLNGEPLGWWAAFSRFGGYAAGLATGLIGFLQVFWDANRQGIHDKIVGTVVVRERNRVVRTP